MKNKFALILLFVATLIFAYDVITLDSITLDSLVLKVIRGILAIVCAIACYGEFKKIKENK